jgi:hypothetical protein
VQPTTIDATGSTRDNNNLARVTDNLGEEHLTSPFSQPLGVVQPLKKPKTSLIPVRIIERDGSGNEWTSEAAATGFGGSADGPVAAARQT